MNSWWGLGGGGLERDSEDEGDGGVKSALAQDALCCMIFT